MKLLIIFCILEMSMAIFTDYCAMSCPSNRLPCKGFSDANGDCLHVRCNNTSQMPCTYARRLDLDDSLKQHFVDKHNEKRNDIAGGVAYFARACRMGTMQWDDDLAELAAINMYYCNFEHDCHNTVVYQSSGQNIWGNFSSEYFNKNLDVRGQIELAIESWFNEKDNTNPRDISAFPRYTPLVIGHFTVMMGDSNIRVGCAIFHLYRKDITAFRIKCNYARTNKFGVPVFAKCSEAASNCSTGTNPDFPNLCHRNEIYNWNEYKLNDFF